MQLLHLALLSVLITASHAISFSTIATVCMTVLNMNKPVTAFFGIFRRRKTPPIKETEVIAEPQDGFFSNRRPMSSFNPFGGFGGNLFFPGFNTPIFGMFGGNRFPPQFRPPQMSPTQRPFSQVPFQPQFQSQQPLQFSQRPSFPHSQQALPSESNFEMDNFRDPRGEEVPGMNIEEAESFFALLSETDESKCISRLVCEMGANPENGGEFGQTIVDIIGSLDDFPEGSKVSEYNEVLNIGIAEGLSSCLSKFSVCDEESYQLVKKAQVDDES